MSQRDIEQAGRERLMEVIFFLKCKKERQRDPRDLGQGQGQIHEEGGNTKERETSRNTIDIIKEK